MCPICHHTLSARELIPIFSYTLQMGKCRHCNSSVSIQYLLVELFTGFAVAMILTPTPIGVTDLLTRVVLVTIVSLLIVLFITDQKTFLLPDKYVMALSLAVILYLYLNNQDLYAILTGIVIGAGFLGFLWLITKGQGIGLGDVKLMIPLGALFGPTTTFILLLLSFIIGGGLASYLLVTKKAGLKTAVPFGPFLAGVAILFIIFPNFSQFLVDFIII